MWNFKNIKFASLVGAILLTIIVVGDDTDGFSESFRIISLGYDTRRFISLYTQTQHIIMFFMPYVFLRIWEAYYR